MSEQNFPSRNPEADLQARLGLPEFRTHQRQAISYGIRRTANPDGAPLDAYFSGIGRCETIQGIHQVSSTGPHQPGQSQDFPRPNGK